MNNENYKFDKMKKKIALVQSDEKSVEMRESIFDSGI